MPSLYLLPFLLPLFARSLSLFFFFLLLAVLSAFFSWHKKNGRARFLPPPSLILKMFRSWGEFNRCAKDVFSLFAESSEENRREVDVSSLHHAQPLSEKPMLTTDALGLSRAGLECAFFVLFGRYPSPTLLRDCFASTAFSSPLLAQDEAMSTLRAHEKSTQETFRAQRNLTQGKGAELLSQGKKVPLLSLDAFLRFITLCAEEEGLGFVMMHPASCSSTRDELKERNDDCAAALPFGARKTAQLQCWRLFESVAGSKGYVTLDDMCSVSLQHPFQDVRAVLEGPALLAESIPHQHMPKDRSFGTSSRQEALVRHVFWIVDRDHDGKARFDDVQAYLLELV